MEVVRQPLRVREQSRRPLDQRLFLRFPRLADAWARLIDRLPPTSRIRQAALLRAVQLTTEPFNRRDLDAYELGRTPDWELHPPREVVEAGLAEPCYRGSAGNREALSGWLEAWGAGRSDPLELIDLGDRGVLLGTMTTRGQASGVPVNQEYAWVGTLKDGKLIRQQEYLHHAEALEPWGYGSSASRSVAGFAAC